MARVERSVSSIKLSGLINWMRARGAIGQKSNGQQRNASSSAANGRNSDAEVNPMGVQQPSGSSATVNSRNLDVEVNRMVWVDMEMTGLNVETDAIMEVACIITDEKLNIVAEGPELVIHQPQTILGNMNEWCKKQHGKSGLTEECLESSLSITEAENELLEFVSEHVTAKASPLAGNSVYMDRLFMKKYMPRLDEYLHYRIVDVSTVKELCKRWNSEVYSTGPKKEFTHRALDDIKESIEELKYYKRNFFRL